jgi:hypothetical protein
MTVPENPPNRRFVWPSDYYSSPGPVAILPRWAPFGCGAASVVVLLIIFIGGAVLSGGAFNSLIDMTIGMSLGEMRGQFTPEVTAAQKASLEAEIKTMRANLRGEKVTVAKVQPFLTGLSNAIRDGKVDPEDVETLERIARNINRSVRR